MYIWGLVLLTPIATGYVISNEVKNPCPRGGDWQLAKDVIPMFNEYDVSCYTKGSCDAPDVQRTLRHWIYDRDGRSFKLPDGGDGCTVCGRGKRYDGKKCRRLSDAPAGRGAHIPNMPGNIN
ncbi:hypothetical protein ROZALSC1DRAFT_28424 [Rozella allomycis CSF55]|uniref:Uncharacterized protein n=1 Tax=Rozella allomycis (strain CSF55) TaxID=988480 RepID=A0A075AXH8_ROZAC|nr:hypothetical protein O9G_001595 [Rozella allomycis CSF55]RKP20048.1 hypothetical protein ROZALSC1DRAFT_28424 [Rozella allomycis CSF55]|eukprot:EPZ33244.1 hypothetical protein O9G_001595 [Rozella allomycis CSF55]